MSRPRRGRRRDSGRARQKAILIYGESPNDTRAIAELIQGLVPDLRVRIEARREPLVLIRDAPLAEVAGRAQRIAAAVASERRRFEVVCVFAHEDCDDFEPRHEEVARRIEEGLIAAGCAAHAVVPAWEIEAWWFLWPEAVRAVVPSWRLPNDYVGRNVGLIRDPKEKLERAVLHGLPTATRSRLRPYRESDSPVIAKFVRERGEAHAPQGASGSYDRFRASLQTCAEAAA